MAFNLSTKRRLSSFDGGYMADVVMAKPDRFTQLESLGADNRRLVARGGGYSYSAASFGGGCMVISMNCFNRILAFDADKPSITVEPGMVLGDLLSFTVPRGLYLPVVPGYPLISIGGCLASNVHGKSTVNAGTMVDWVESLELFHPEFGYRQASRSENTDLFNATCGGFGLTGIITRVQLRLTPLPGDRVVLKRQPVASLADGLEQIEDIARSADFAYSWHDGSPSDGVFGRGHIFSGDFISGSAPKRRPSPTFPVRPNSSNRGHLPICLWGGRRTRLVNELYRRLTGLRANTVETDIFDALFPFAKLDNYFRMYGPGGLIECQILLPKHDAGRFVRKLESAILRERVQTTFLSLKMFGGHGSLLRFAGEGICLSFDMARNPEGLAFLDVVDRLMLESGGIPYLAKDSRISKGIVAEAYGANYDQFRQLIHNLDPGRRFGSELAERLEI